MNHQIKEYNIKILLGNKQYVFDIFLDLAIPTSDEIQEIKKINVIENDL